MWIATTKANSGPRLTSYRMQTNTLTSRNLAPCIDVIADAECVNKRCWIFTSSNSAPERKGWYQVHKDKHLEPVSEKEARSLNDDERLYISGDAAAAIVAGRPVVFGTAPYLHGSRLVLYDHARVEWAYAAVTMAEVDNIEDAKQMLRLA